MAVDWGGTTDPVFESGFLLCHPGVALAMAFLSQEGNTESASKRFVLIFPFHFSMQ